MNILQLPKDQLDLLSLGAMTPDSADVKRLLCWQRLSELITPTIHQVVEFAKRVPGKNIL